MTKPGRRKFPLGVKLDACLILLGFDPRADEIEWDHFPALGLRDKNPDGTYTPDANDPRYIQPLGKSAHGVKTRGSGATTRGSDIGEITKTRHLTQQHEDYRRRLLSKAPGVPREKSGKIRGRGFAR